MDRRAVRFRILTVAIGCILALIPVEIVWQIIDWPPAQISGWRTFRPEQEWHQLGLRGRPIDYGDEDLVIVLLGDSQAEAIDSAVDRMPERTLEDQLRKRGHDVRVVTLGVIGWGQDQQLFALREYFARFRAELVILWQTTDNDVWNNMFPTHIPKDGFPKPTFWLEGDQLRGPSERSGDRLNSRIKVVAALQQLFTSRDGAWEARLPAPYEPLTRYDGKVMTDWQERWDKDIGDMRRENLDNEKSHLSIELTPPSPRMAYGLRLTRRLMQEIETLCMANGAEFAILNVRTPIVDDREKVRVLNGRFYRTSPQQVEESRRVINGGFEQIDVDVTVEKFQVSPTNRHLTEPANKQVMTDLAEELEPWVARLKPPA